MGKKSKRFLERYQELVAEQAQREKQSVVLSTAEDTTASYYYDALVYNTGIVYTTTADTGMYMMPSPEPTPKVQEPSLPADNIFNRVLDVDWEE